MIMQEKNGDTFLQGHYLTVEPYFSFYFFKKINFFYGFFYQRSLTNLTNLF